MRNVGAMLGSLVFFVIAPGTVAGWIPYAISGWQMQPPVLGVTAVPFVGAGLVGIGAVCLVECFVRFAITGHGTPAPVAPTEILVVSGFYRHVRNPMYLAVVTIILGQGLLLGSLALLRYAGVVWVLFHFFVLLYEEPTLAARYGVRYSEYRAQVRRWWPRATAWKGTAS